MRTCLGWALLCLAVDAGLCSVSGVAPLPDFKAAHDAVRARIRGREDGLAWYDFSRLPPEGLRFVPGPGKGVLKPVAGRWPDQQAAHLFHGRLQGPAIAIPETGFTVCFWLRVNGLEKVDRMGYKRTAGGIMATGSGYYDGWRLSVNPGHASLTFSLGRPRVGARSLTGASCITLHKWQHVAVTWDLERFAIWIDGELRAQGPADMQYAGGPKSRWFRIGECDSGLGVLDFDIADVGLFGSVLPADTLKRMGDPEYAIKKALARIVARLAPPAAAGGEEAYRRQFEVLFALKDGAGSPSVRTVKAIAREHIAKSYRREGRVEDARRTLEKLAADEAAPLHCRADAMLAIGDLYRDAKSYSAARRQYEKAREFFTGRHEAFRVEAVLRLEDIETLRDGMPFRSERRRRIDRISHPAIRFYVAPGGDDANPGTRARPFRTLEHAREALRALKKKGPLPRGGVAVVLGGGVYRREKNGFALTAEDSGTPEAPIIYMAAPNETPVLRGGRALTGFRPLEDPTGKARIPAAAQPHVVQVDLNSAGVTEFGKLTPRGNGSGALGSRTVPAHLELFFNGRTMPLARWPNDSPKLSERFARIDLRGQKTVKDRGRVVAREADFFSYTNPRQDAWADEPDGWLYGCWQWLYFGSYKRIAHIDTKQRRIAIDWNCTTPYLRKRRGFIQGAPYLGINLLCELDAPGEWYLDRRSGRLFFWPPADLNKGAAVVSGLDKPLITLDHVSDIVFRGLTLEAGRLHGVVEKQCRRVLFAGCTIRDMGGSGVIIDKGADNEVVGCDMAWLGDSGIEVSGGDAQKLVPSGHLVENCHIHHFARWNRLGYKPAVHMRGVGVRVLHCLVHDTPDQAFLADGNDHILAYSEIHDVVDEGGDAGAFYMYGDSVARAQLERGNVVLYNYWHHLPRNETFKGVSTVSRMGIYIDNFNGAITVYGNIFSHVDFSAGAVFFGTNDNFIENNIFYRCFRGIYLTDRTWLYDKVNKPPKFIIDATLAAAAANPVWARRYPRLTGFPRQAKDTSPFLLGNVIARNLACRCNEFLHGSQRVMSLARIEQNWTGSDPGFKDPEHGDFHLDPDSPTVVTLGFEPLPLAKIGLYNDALRATWPVVHPCGHCESLRVENTIDRKPASRMPACAARPAAAPITIDGRLDPAEWGGLDNAQAVVLDRTPTNEATPARPSLLWLRWDRENLYLALMNELNPGERPRPRPNAAASWWKDVDMAEIIFEGPRGKNAPDWWPRSKKHGPLFYLLGDCAGQADTYCAGDLPLSQAEALLGVIEYAAVAAPGRWTAEWRIPLSAILLEPEPGQGCCFNVGVHKPGTRPGAKGENALDANDKWAVWRGANGANWKVWNTGMLYLR